VCEQTAAMDVEHRRCEEVMRQLMAGKTAPASLMHSSRLDCIGLDADTMAAIKPCSSAPNIDLLLDAEPGRRASMRSNEAEDVVKVDANGWSIPRIVVLCSNDEELTMIDGYADDTQQPDIVQSTKSGGSLPRQAAPVPPVAPPRRRKAKTPSPLLANVAAATAAEV